MYHFRTYIEGNIQTPRLSFQSLTPLNHFSTQLIRTMYGLAAALAGLPAEGDAGPLAPCLVSGRESVLLRIPLLPAGMLPLSRSYQKVPVKCFRV